MQVFIVGSPFETAMALDKKRKHKQLVEIYQILDALNGNKAWKNHPCVLQYKGYEQWLLLYRMTLEYLNMDMVISARGASETAERFRPPFHTQDYFDQMKRRLYTKNPDYYKQWGELGTSEINWYWSPSEKQFIKYQKGKRIN